MAEDAIEETAPESDPAVEYHAPAIEEVVTRDGLEREAAYAGVPQGSGPKP